MVDFRRIKQVSRKLMAAAAFIGIALFRIGRLVLGVWYLWGQAGPVWAGLAALLLLLFRFSWPVRIGVFLAAVNVLHWPWFFALVLAAPRLFTMVPGLCATQLARWRHPRPLWPGPGEAA
jgi:hypothetical protein